MSSVQIKKVESLRNLRTFVDFHYDLYEGNPYGIPNLFMDGVSILRKNKDAAFGFCEAEYYIARKQGKVVGRVAAVINRRTNEKWKTKIVRFGWIDFIDDLEVSRALFDEMAAYGRSRGMTEMMGPLGFIDMDPEGMLTWSFGRLDTMITIYSYPYYPQHIEKLDGWEVDQNHVEYFFNVPKEIPERCAKIAEVVETRYDLHIEKLTRREVKKTDYGRKVFDIINETYKDLYGYSEPSEKQIDHYVNAYLHFAGLNMITLIEN